MIKARLIAPEDLQPGNKADPCDAFKFVKVGGEYRFATIHTDHNMMVDAGEQSLVEAAGAFAIYSDVMTKGVPHSMTLKKSCDHEHFEEIAVLLKRELKLGGIFG